MTLNEFNEKSKIMDKILSVKAIKKKPFFLYTNAY